MVSAFKKNSIPLKGQTSGIRRNTLFAFLSHLFRMLTNVVLFISIARTYGPEEFGQFTAAHTLATIFLFLADFGFDTLLASQIARNRERANELALKYLSTKFLFALGATVLMLVAALVQGVSMQTRILMYVFSTYVLVSALTNFFFALFKGFEQMQHETKISFSMNLVLLVAVLFLGGMNASLVSVALAFTGSRLIGLVLAWRTSMNIQAMGRFAFGLAQKSDIAMIAVFGFQALFGNLFFVQDTLLLSAWKGDYQVGIYQSVFKLISVLLVVQEVIVIAMLPVLSRLHRENKDEWFRLGNLMNKTLYLVGLPITLILVVYPDQIISLVYGAGEYQEAVPILRMFGLILLIRFAVETYALMLTTSQRQKTRLAVVMAATGLNLAVNWFTIPSWGPEGAAVASLVTNLFVGIGYVATTGNLFKHWVLNSRHVVPLITAALVGILLWNVRSLPVWYSAVPGITIYGLVAYLIGYSKSERQLVFAREGSIVPWR